MIFMKKQKYTIGDLVAAEGDNDKYVFGLISDIKYNKRNKIYTYNIHWSDIGNESDAYTDGNLKCYMEIIDIIKKKRSMKIV